MKASKGLNTRQGHRSPLQAVSVASAIDVLIKWRSLDLHRVGGIYNLLM